MRRSFLGRTIPAILTLAVVALPAVTTADMLLSAMTSGTTSRAAFPVSTSGSSIADVVVPASKSVVVTPTPTRVPPPVVAIPMDAQRFGLGEAGDRGNRRHHRP